MLCPEQRAVLFHGFVGEHVETRARYAALVQRRGKGGFIPSMYVNTLPEDKRPDACIGCGSCAAVCPQQIDIPGTLADFAGRLAG